MKGNKPKKLLSLLLAMCMVLTMTATPAFAASGDTVIKALKLQPSGSIEPVTGEKPNLAKPTIINSGLPGDPDDKGFSVDEVCWYHYDPKGGKNAITASCWSLKMIPGTTM